MKELERKDMPEVSGGQADPSGTPIASAYPIVQVPPPEQPDPLIAPETPLS